MKMFDDIIRYYEKHKIRLILGLILFIAVALSLQLYIFFNEKISEDDMYFDRFGWTETCDDRVYDPQERIDFCNTCLELGGDECDWPLDMNIIVSKVERTVNTGGEMHCFSIIDGVNYYTEKGSYYGLTNNTLFTWQVLDSTMPHTVEFCCGIQRETPIANLPGIEKKWPQACIIKEIGPWCVRGQDDG